MDTWIQTGGQDPNLEVNYLSMTWWWEMRDKRSEHYPLMTCPTAVILLSVLYCVLASWIGPRAMQNREPYSLKHALAVYNLFQVVISAYIFIMVVDIGWDYSLGKHQKVGDIKLHKYKLTY